MVVHAQMDERELHVHEANYHRFMLGVKWFAVHFAALAAFLTLWFCTTAGFWAGLITGIVVFTAGAFAMTHGLNHSSESHPPVDVMTESSPRTTGRW